MKILSCFKLLFVSLSRSGAFRCAFILLGFALCPSVLAALPDDGYKAYRGGEWSRAAQIFQMEVKQNYSNSRARYYLADCLARLGQREEARTQYNACLTLNNDPAVVNCCRVALTRMSIADQASGGAVAPLNNIAPYVAPNAALLDPQPYQFTPLTAGRASGNLRSIGDAAGNVAPSAYVEPSEAMDALTALSLIPRDSGLGSVANANGARLDNQYLQNRKQVLDEYCKNLDQLRRDAFERIRTISERAVQDRGSVDRYYYVGNRRFTNSDYFTQVNQITTDSNAQVDEINRQLGASALDIVARARRDIGHLDTTHSSIAEQVNSKGGISKMTSQGTDMYVRNFINFGGDDSDLLPSLRNIQPAAPPLLAVPGKLGAPASAPLKSMRPGPNAGRPPVAKPLPKDAVDVWR